MTSFKGFPVDAFPYSAANVGEALAGLIKRDNAGNPVQGVLGPVFITAVSSSWKVAVTPFAFILKVGAGVRITGLSAGEQVDIAPATGMTSGQARIDLIAWDAATEKLVVVPGIPATSPTAPAAGGFHPLAHVRVNFGDGMVIGGQISLVYTRTSLAGESRDAGTVAKRSVARDSVTVVQVTFKAGTFSAAPNVQATTLSDTRVADSLIDNITKDGFVLRLVNRGTTAVPIGATWRAEQI